MIMIQKRLRDYDLFQNYKKWYNGTGVFKCFVHATPFVTLKHYPDFPLSALDAEDGGLIAKVISTYKEYEKTNVLCFVDLPEALSLKVAVSLYKTYSLMPILTIRHIQHPHGLVGNPESISHLLQYGERLDELDCDGYVFVLDSTRYADYEDGVYKERFNNQYELTEFDLPPLEMLTDLGYKKLVFMYQQPMKEDVAEYLEYIRTNGMDVDQVVL